MCADQAGVSAEVCLCVCVCARARVCVCVRERERALIREVSLQAGIFLDPADHRRRKNRARKKRQTDGADGEEAEEAGGRTYDLGSGPFLGFRAPWQRVLLSGSEGLLARRLQA